VSARILTPRSALSLGALAVVLVLALIYLLVAVVQYNPFSTPMRMTVLMPNSGGLLLTSPVSYRGIPVGHVRTIGLRPGGVRVTVDIDEGTRIPVDTDVAVADMSFAGEQYLDFRPRSDGGPFLAAGAVIGPNRTSRPVPFSTLVTDAATLVGEIDPNKINTVTTEAATAFDGTAADLQHILDGGNYVLTGLEGVLPQTVDAMHNSQVLLNTVYQVRGDLDTLGPAARGFTGRLNHETPTIDRILDRTPRLFDDVRDITRRGPQIRDTLRDVHVTTGLIADRLPALRLFLPGLISLGPVAQTTLHDGRINAIASGYPALTCDYNTPRRPPNDGGHLPPYLWRYCPTTAPDLLQRGAQYVPRPKGDTTATAPTGVDPLRRAPTEPGPPPAHASGPVGEGPPPTNTSAPPNAVPSPSMTPRAPAGTSPLLPFGAAAAGDR
jgi:phospholipid/cholesterol/gamma-HCH transport system substrate-binding protein